MSTLNGISLPPIDQQYLVHHVDLLRGNRKRRRTDRLLSIMSETGFDPARDLCVMPATYVEAFNHHPCFRFCPVQSISFLSHRLFEEQAA